MRGGTCHAFLVGASLYRPVVLHIALLQDTQQGPAHSRDLTDEHLQADLPLGGADLNIPSTIATATKTTASMPGGRASCLFLQ